MSIIETNPTSRPFLPFGGSFHCATLDVYREGDCEDYFPKQIPGHQRRPCSLCDALTRSIRGRSGPRINVQAKRRSVSFAVGAEAIEIVHREVR